MIIGAMDSTHGSRIKREDVALHHVPHAPSVLSKDVNRCSRYVQQQRHHKDHEIEGLFKPSQKRCTDRLERGSREHTVTSASSESPRILPANPSPVNKLTGREPAPRIHPFARHTTLPTPVLGDPLDVNDGVPVHTSMKKDLFSRWKNGSRGVLFPPLLAAQPVTKQPIHSPKLMKDLQRFLDRELSVLSPLDRGGDVESTRAKVYLEALKIISEHFHCFGSFLPDLVNEVERALRVRDQQLGELSVWKRDATIAHRFTQDMLKQQKECYEDRLHVMEERVHKAEQERLALDNEKQHLVYDLNQLRNAHENLRQEKRDDGEKILSLIQAVKDSEERSTALSERLAKTIHDAERTREAIDQLRALEQEYIELKESHAGQSVSLDKVSEMREDHNRAVLILKSEETRLRHLLNLRESQLQSYKKKLQQANHTDLQSLDAAAERRVNDEMSSPPEKARMISGDSEKYLEKSQFPQMDAEVFP